MKDVNEVKVLVYFICIGMVLSTIMALISFYPKMGKKMKIKVYFILLTLQSLILPFCFYILAYFPCKRKIKIKKTKAK